MRATEIQGVKLITKLWENYTTNKSICSSWGGG